MVTKPAIRPALVDLFAPQQVKIVDCAHRGTGTPFYGLPFHPAIVAVAGLDVNWGSLRFQTDSELHPSCRTRTGAMLTVFTSPSRYTQGKGATAALGHEMTALGLEGPVLIIAGKTVIGLLAQTWQQSLDEAGLRHAVHRFGGECSLAEIERVKAAARELTRATIVGAGGGKVLDTARAAAADLGLPVVNCPTVASSDAPCSALSVIYTEEGVFQEYRFYRKNPDLVLVDTEVIAQAPPRLLVAGMGDALATWFEARTCVAGHVEEHARGRLDPERGRPGRALLPDPAGRRCRRASGRRDQGRHARARAAGRGQHAALGPGLRILRAWPRPMPSTTA